MTTGRLSPLDCTCFRVRGAARRVTQIYGRHLAPTGLKISQFSLLGFVSAEGPVSIGRLSELLTTDRTTLTRNLRPLLSAGLIERATSGDKRRHELVATTAGRATFKRALPLSRCWRRRSRTPAPWRAGSWCARLRCRRHDGRAGPPAGLPGTRSPDRR